MSKICIICEGSYPYVVGGVSSWVHDLIRINSEHEFKIICILPNKEFAVMKYELPKNVSELKNIILNPNLNISTKKVFKNNFFYKGKIKKKIVKLMDFLNLPPNNSLTLYEDLRKEKLGSPSEIVVSSVFWDALLTHYNDKFSSINFNIFYWTYRNIFLNLLSLLEEDIPEADIYHPIATGYAGFIASIAKNRGMGNVVLTEHGIYPREREEEVLNAKWIQKDFKEIWIEFFYFLSKVSYEYSDKIITLFDYNMGLQKELGAPKERCSVISNGVDIDRFDAVIREKREGFHIGAVLRVVPIKDVKMLLKAFKIAKRKLRNTKFYIIGPTDENQNYYEECKQLMKDLDLSNDVIFTGKVQVDEYYSFLDLMILSSISEGQPLSILEGLACGIPFVSTDVGNCREILKEKYDIGEAGIIVPPTSYEDLADGIVKLYQNKERMKILGENGKKIVKKYYRRETFINEYKELYRKLGE